MKIASQLIDYLRGQGSLSHEQLEWLARQGYIDRENPGEESARPESTVTSMTRLELEVERRFPPRTAKGAPKTGQVELSELAEEIADARPAWDAELRCLYGIASRIDAAASAADMPLVLRNVHEGAFTEAASAWTAGGHESREEAWRAACFAGYWDLGTGRNWNGPVINAYRAVLDAALQGAGAAHSWILRHPEVRWVYNVARAQHRLSAALLAQLTADPGALLREAMAARNARRYLACLLLLAAQRFARVSVAELSDPAAPARDGRARRTVDWRPESRVWTRRLQGLRSLSQDTDDGHFRAIATDDALDVWDLETRRLRYSAPARAALVASSGDVAVSFRRNTWSLWRWEGRRLQALPHCRRVDDPFPTTAVDAAVIAAEGPSVFTARNSGSGAARLWLLRATPESGFAVLREASIEDTIRCAAIRPDGSDVALAGDRGVYLWRATGELTAALTGRSIRSVCWHRGGFWAAGATDGKVYPIESGGRNAGSWTLPGPVALQVWAPGGAELLHVTTDGEARLYRLDRARPFERWTLPASSRIDRAAFSAEGARLAAVTSNRLLTILDVVEGRSICSRLLSAGESAELLFPPTEGALLAGPEWRRPQDVRGLASWGADGIACVGNDRRKIEFWRLSDLTLLRSVETASDVLGMAAARGRLFLSCSDGRVEVLHDADRRRSGWQAAEAGVAIAAGPGGSPVFVGDEHGVITAREPETGTAQFRIRAHDGPIGALATHPSGETLGSAGPEGVRLWAVSMYTTTPGAPPRGEPRANNIDWQRAWADALRVDPARVTRWLAYFSVRHEEPLRRNLENGAGYSYAELGLTGAP